MPRQHPTKSLPETLEYRKTRNRAMDFMLNMALGAISLVFVGLSLAYVFGRRLSESWLEFSLPASFWASTLLLGLCSLALHRAQQAYLNDQAGRLRQSLFAAFGAGLLFLISQYIAWIQLARSGIGLAENPSASYLYVISWLHAGHIAVGLVFLVFSLRSALRGTRDEVQALLYFSDAAQGRKLRQVTLYWHVVDGIWLYLFLFFLFFHT